MTIYLPLYPGQKLVHNNFFTNINFLTRHKVVVNEPVQAHFTVEGVQSYSYAYIRAMKTREDKLNHRDGEFIKVKYYQAADFEEENEFSQYKDKNMNVKSPYKKKKKKTYFKTNARNSMSQANQSLIKIYKEFTKKSALYKRLYKLTTAYKKHFKTVNKGLETAKNKDKDKQSGQDDDGQPAENEYFNMSEDEGVNCSVPIDAKASTKGKSANTKVDYSAVNDDFEEVSWEEGAKSRVSNSSNNSLSYSERLGNAVHLLFK